MLGFMVYFLIQLYGRQLITVGDFALILGLGMEVDSRFLVHHVPGG